jgi:cytoskeletal protein CcmA (bactofilin family)
MIAANEHHARAMELADQADVLERRGLEAQSIQVYQRALAEAEAAVRSSTEGGAGVKTLSALYRSAASLAMDSREWRKAQDLIERASEMLPPDLVEDELKNLLKRLPLTVEASVLDVEVTGSGGRNALESDVEIKGSLRVDNDLTFNGTLEGEIVAAGELTLGTSSNVHGDVRARSLNLFGNVRGNVFVGDTCKIFPSGVLIGDLKATHLALEKGASFMGQSRVGPMHLSALVVGNHQESPDKGNEKFISAVC